MPEVFDACGDLLDGIDTRSHLPGAGQRLEKMQGHWVLARAGKRVLRPGALALMRQMIDALSISQDDRVVEICARNGGHRKWF